MNKLLESMLLRMVEEDTGVYDITTAFTPNKKVHADIIAEDNGIVSGVSEISALFNLFNIKILESVSDGDTIQKGEKAMLLSGHSRDILLTERTALNILSRMSGISTLTKSFVDIAKSVNPGVVIAATRKTTPLFRYFEKRAVKIGGGDTHRLGLDDCVLIKDNHLRLFKDVSEAVKTARNETSFTHKISIEVNNSQDALSAAENEADIIMLDNIHPGGIKEIISSLGDLRDNVIIEASGNITLKTIRDYAESGADVISIGQITHSAPPINFSLAIK